MFDIIRKVINDWDPIGLFPGVPIDEYDPEVGKIERCYTENAYELSYSIKNIFIEYFDEDLFRKTDDECLNIANQIIKSINQK